MRDKNQIDRGGSRIVKRIYMYEVAYPTCYQLTQKRQPSAAEGATMLYGQHRAFQKTITSTFLVFRFDVNL
jgi:hypothetical protein